MNITSPVNKLFFYIILFIKYHEKPRFFLYERIKSRYGEKDAFISRLIWADKYSEKRVDLKFN